MLFDLSTRSRTFGACVIPLVFLVIASAIQQASDAGPPPDEEIMAASLGECLDPVTFNGSICEPREGYCRDKRDGDCQEMSGAKCRPDNVGPHVSCPFVRVNNVIATGDCVSGDANASQLEPRSCEDCGALICADGTAYTTFLNCQNGIEGGTVVDAASYRSCNAEPEVMI